MPSRRNQWIRFVFRQTILLLLLVTTLSTVGCQDGPLYALKVANPYFSMKEWKADEAIGVTDHKRRLELQGLADSIASLSPERQAFWIDHLEQVMKNDQSAEMRRLAVSAAGATKIPKASEIIEQGLKDDSVKVRMEACRSLGRRGDESSALLLAQSVGSETEMDVRHAAMTALASYNTPIAIDSLRSALSDRNPATRQLAVTSLKKSTGANYGNDPQVWLAKLEGKPTLDATKPETSTARIAERVRNLF